MRELPNAWRAKVNDLLKMVRPVLTPEQNDEATGCVAAGEYGVALETICYALAKLQELPESAVLDRVRELKAVMQMDSYLVDGLLDRANR